MDIIKTKPQAIKISQPEIIKKDNEEKHNEHFLDNI